MPGLLTLNKGEDWEKLYNYFQVETGYEIYTDTLNAADYRVPQIRKRVFVVGFRQPIEFEFPKPLYRDSLSLDLLNQHLQDWIPAKLALVYLITIFVFMEIGCGVVMRIFLQVLGIR